MDKKKELNEEVALAEEEMDSVAGGEESDLKPKLSATGKRCPIRGSVLAGPEQQCFISDR